MDNAETMECPMDSQPHERKTPPEAEVIEDEAIGWLTCLNDENLPSEDPYHDWQVRNRAFFEWVLRSPVHLRTFMEIVVLEYQLNSLDLRAFEDSPR
jgi:hypothetical protein